MLKVQDSGPSEMRSLNHGCALLLMPQTLAGILTQGSQNLSLSLPLLLSPLMLVLLLLLLLLLSLQLAWRQEVPQVLQRLQGLPLAAAGRE